MISCCVLDAARQINPFVETEVVRSVKEKSDLGQSEEAKASETSQKPCLCSVSPDLYTLPQVDGVGGAGWRRREPLSWPIGGRPVFPVM